MKYFKKIAAAVLVCSSYCAHAQVAQIPFETMGPRMFIKVQANKSDSLRFLFDTGGTGVLIDSLTAEKAGISKSGRKKTQAHGAGESQPSISIKHQQLNLPSKISIKDVEFTMMNLDGMNMGSPMPIQGIVGYDLMKNYVTKIDFESSKLLLYKTIKEVDTAGYTSIPFQFYEGIEVPRIPVTITLTNGESFTGNAMFDSGASTTILVFSPFSNYYDLGSKFGEAVSFKGKGLNSETNDQVVVIKALSFGGFNFGQMKINVNVNDKAGKDNRFLGLLGQEILKYFDIIMDYKTKKIYMKPNKFNTFIK